MNDNQPIPKISTDERFVNGISDFLKEGQPDTYANGIAIDHRSDPRGIELLPRSVKESGSIVTDLVKWMTTYPSNLTTFMYGDTGNFYSRTTVPVYSLISQIPASHGNGLFYYPEDDYVYLTGDSTLNRYGPITNGSPKLTLNFLQALGGVPTNTNSLSLVAASSQYASHVDAGGFDITGDIALGCWINPNSLPTVGNTMALIAKWKESGNLRSYKLAIGAISGTFGSGTDSSLTISSNTTEAPIDSACTGTAGTQSLSATNTSFAAGQQVLIHQSQGTSAGQYERNSIQSYTAGTITLVNNLIGTYTTGAQVRVLKQYTNVTINSGITYTAKAWNGATGGILAFLANGTVTINGTISARGVDGVLSTAAGSIGGGFAGGLGIFNNTITYEQGGQGAGSAGAGAFSTSANGTGGGGGLRVSGGARAGGGGGGYGLAGTNGTGFGNEAGYFTIGTGGGTGGALDLSNLQFGGGGGGAVNQGDHSYSSSASGGGAVFIEAVTFVNSGTIIADGGSVPANVESSGGAGAGGSILIKAQTATMGNMTASGGIQTGGGLQQGTGGGGGDGRINLDYLTSFTQGTITPVLNTIQDNTLTTAVTYQLQFSVSTDGTAVETVSQNVPVQTGIWQHVAISWASASSTTTFFLNAVSQGTAVGAATAIANKASPFYVGAYFGASAVQSFYDGLIDDVMVFNAQQTASFWTTVLSQQIASNTPNLVAFYELNGSLNDATANAYNLTGTNSPTYSTSVPYPGATTRLDIDLTQAGTGNTYTLPTAIVEDATDEIVFTPEHDPQKSIQVAIAAVGTGNWTVIVHDAQNNLIASVTYPNASLYTGAFEFMFTNPWRVLTNFTNVYHVHFISTVGDGTITTGTASNLSTAGYTTYFSFLVTDTAYHPIGQMLNQMVIGNERYVGTYNGLPASYNPNTLILPAAWHVRCFAYWNEYLCIGVVRGNSITDFDMGRVYFWDGSALTFNFYIDIEGGVNAMQGYRGNLYIWVGYQGYLYEYTSGALNAEKAKRQPHIAEGDTMEVFPDATIMWKTLLRYGSAGTSNSTTINRGLYTYGSFLTLGFFTQMYRDSLSFDYVASTGNYGSTISIGSVNTVQNEILMSWRDGIVCGVDNISTNNLPASYGTIELLVQDDGRVDKNKTALTMLVEHLPLRAGETMQAKYNLDRGSWITSAINSTVGSMKTPIVIPEERYQEYQVGAILGSIPQVTQTLSSEPAYQRGTALSGLEFGSTYPGTNGTNYFSTVPQDFSYFAGKGFTLIRLPFSWERIQPTLNGPLDPTYKGYIDQAITYAKANNMQIVLDPHNYGRYELYADGGITEEFTEQATNLIYPWADYSQSGNIVLRDFGESLLGTFNNPDSPATGYTVAFTLQFNSRDTNYGAEGLDIRPMWQSDNDCYQFNVLNDSSNTWQLQSVSGGLTSTLVSGTFGFSWGAGIQHTFVMDINQGTSGYINIKLDGSPLYTTNSIPSQYASTLSDLTYRSIDAMKYTKDNIPSQPTDAFITSYCQFLATNFNITHIAIAVPLDANADWIATGVNPAPRTIENYFASWCSAIHAAGLKVMFRGTFGNFEAIYNFPYLPNGAIPQGTSTSAATDGTSTWMGRLYQRILTLGSNFQSGDIFAPFPEQTGSVFNGNSFLSTAGSGIQTNYRNFFEQLPTTITNAFSAIGISGIITNLTTNNFSEIASGWLGTAFFTSLGVITMDYYGGYYNDVFTGTQYASDLTTIYNANSHLPIGVQEWSDYYNGSLNQTDRTNYLNGFYNALAGLSALGILTAFNYWGGWIGGSGGAVEGILTNTGTTANPIWGLTYNGSILQGYFDTPSLNTGKVAFFARGVHAELIAPLTLNVNGDTSNGGYHSEIVGTTALPITAFANLWTQLATAYVNEPGVFAYDTMNEWHDMPVDTTSSTYNSTATVTLANQAAINAIRAVDTKKWIMIESDSYTGIQSFTSMYGSDPTQWWTDASNKTMLEFHYYQDSDHSGSYSTAWSSTLRTRIPTDLDPALEWAQGNGTIIYMGEYGVPNGNSSDDVNWQTDLNTVLGYFDTYGCYGTQWAGGAQYSAATTLEPTSNYTVDQAQMAILIQHLGKSNLTTTVSGTSPKITGISFERDPRINEIKLQTD